MGRSLNEMNSGASAAKVTPERLDSSGVLKPSVAPEPFGPKPKAGSRKARTEPILSEEDLATSRRSYVEKGGELPSTGAGKTSSAPSKQVRGVLVVPTIKSKNAAAALQDLHTHISGHLNELASHTDHEPKTLRSLEIAKGHLDQARAAIGKGNRLKSPQEINGKSYTFTSDAHKSYQQASRHLVEAHRQLSAGHVKEAAESRMVSAGLPEREHVAELHQKVNTLRVTKQASPFKEIKFGGQTFTGSAIPELGKLAEETGAPEPVKQKIQRAIKGTPRVSKRKRLQGVKQPQLIKGDYTNPKRSASPTSSVVGRGGQAQRKPGQTPGFEG